MNKFSFSLVAVTCLVVLHVEAKQVINRQALIGRNSPVVENFDSLSSLSVGNGNFAFTVDATGLQTFPENYRNGVPLGTESQWAWHSFANPEHFMHEEVLKDYNFGRGRMEPYAIQYKTPKRKKDACNWFRMNPHRLHLGIIGFDFGKDVQPRQITDVHQRLDLWKGCIESNFMLKGQPYEVLTCCHPSEDKIAVKVNSKAHTGIRFRFPYPTGSPADAACNWDADDHHTTTIVSSSDHQVVLKRQIDTTTYFVYIAWNGNADFTKTSKNSFLLMPAADSFSFTCAFSPDSISNHSSATVTQTFVAARKLWLSFWKNGAVVDFSQCTDRRASELERRVVLSQYLLAIQCAGNVPPQETGLTYNSWYGKFHLEMIWWHEAQFALWGHSDLLQRTLNWYEKAEPIAREIAHRQGYNGVRWMKMTDPSAMEAPSNVGSFLIWQQPHLIYLAELVYRAHPSINVIKKYNRLVQETAEFMYSFATYDKKNDRYILKGIIPAQETLPAATTVNPPLELSYWHFTLGLAQKWRERLGQPRNLQWDKLLAKLSPLVYNEDSLSLAAELAIDTYTNPRYTSDHPAVLGAVGMFPMSRLVNMNMMKNTLHWIMRNWHWNTTWGWDYPLTAMCAARIGEPKDAVDALLMNQCKNTYLINGHNYQDGRLRIYLPGNGGLLTAVAMMCAGWDGCNVKNPGFPHDGTWNVRWEGLMPLP